MGKGDGSFHLRTAEELFPAALSSDLCSGFPLFPFLWDDGRAGEGLGGWGRQTGGVLVASVEMFKCRSSSRRDWRGVV